MNETITTIHDTLNAVRFALRELHKALLDAERVQYERAFGRLESDYQALFLALDDPQFAWLRPLARFIIGLDERATGEEFDTAARERAIEEIRALLVPDATGTLFQRLYHDALQRRPEVVMAHATVMRALPARTSLAAGSAS
jgi:hypothetical protein